MSPAKTRISNIEPSTIANRMHPINWNCISFLKNLNISRILKLPFVEMPEHIVFRIESRRYLKGSIGVLELNGSRFPYQFRTAYSCTHDENSNSNNNIDENHLVHSVAVYTTLALRWTESLHSKTFASYLLFVIFFLSLLFSCFHQKSRQVISIDFFFCFCTIYLLIVFATEEKNFHIVVNSRNIENAKCNQKFALIT